ncbi:Hypothetical_protein [Hexamita inflata]|uniref:Hypothetical_protein n=1 Tax=Hexamita inflata TaxID=28002 RepID=A0AA86PPD0_9EUKA|nr:Hypothetical protein HINF_LOCUS31520 [Hexamita inflata]
MPFVIVTNNSQLQIRWSDELSDQKIEMSQIQNQYNYIGIQGTNRQQLEIYDILNRTQALEITNCTVDVSKVIGNMEIICMNNCICQNNFTIQCSTQRLNIIDTFVQCQQLLDLKIVSLTVQVSSTLQFDFQNCRNLNCSFNSLTFIDLNVDLKQLNGTWNTLRFKNCNLSGQADNNQYRVTTVEVSITEQNQLNNLVALENLECNSFYISNSKHETYQTINLNQLQNLNKQKKYFQAYFDKIICDISKVTDVWTYIKFTNCCYLCDPDTLNSNLQHTNIEVTQNDQYQPCDNTTLFKNNVYNFKVFQLCKPKELRFNKQNINLDDFQGSWLGLVFQYCTFTNNIVENPGSIKAKSIRISKMDYKLISYFSADSIELSYSTISKTFPNTNWLIIQSSTVNVTEPNYSIQHLTLFSAKLIRFSVLSLPSLVSIDMNYILKTSRHYSTKEAIIHYIRQKKKNRNILKQRLNRVVYEQKKKQSAQNRISSLVRSFNSVLCEQVQRSLLIFDE